MPRFVVLEHDHPVLHWDLMLEAGSMLETWRLSAPPLEPGCVITATALPLHRAMYLDYEGPVSGDRGNVRRWDVGTFTEDAGAAPESRTLTMQGTRIRGQVHLQQLDGDDWRFCRLI